MIFPATTCILRMWWCYHDVREALPSVFRRGVSPGGSKNLASREELALLANSGPVLRNKTQGMSARQQAEKRSFLEYVEVRPHRQSKLSHVVNHHQPSG